MVLFGLVWLVWVGFGRVCFFDSVGFAQLFSLWASPTNKDRANSHRGALVQVLKGCDDRGEFLGAL